MSFDLATSLRRIKPEKQTGSLSRRGDDELPFLTMPVTAGRPLLLDTTVYIDTLTRQLPLEVVDLLRARQINHSAIAVAELAHSLGRLDSLHPGTVALVKTIRSAIDDIPTHRLNAPDTQSIAEAGLLTGLVARLRGLQSMHLQPLLNDAILFVQAFGQGCCLLSRNASDFDYLLQLMPAGRVLLYKKRLP